MNYKWYTLTSDTNLTQGDLIRNCPILIPPDTLDISDENSMIGVEAQSSNVIIMSQACDLANKKLEFVVVCPYHSIEEFENVFPQIKDNKLKEQIRRGNVPGYHMIAASEDKRYPQQISIVNFRYIHSIPFSYLESFMKKDPLRLCLLSPYREHLSQAFARFFMRVGLPVNIPPFK